MTVYGGGCGSMRKGVFSRRHLRYSGRRGYKDGLVTCTGRAGEVDCGTRSGVGGGCGDGEVARVRARELCGGGGRRGLDGV